MTPAELRKSRIAVLVHFFILGVGNATWAARLPAIKSELHLSDFRLSLALFAVAGVQKALVRGIGPMGVVAMGTLTAVGGGVGLG